MLSTKISDVLNVMLAGVRSRGQWVDVELSSGECEAIRALMKERDDLEKDRNRLQLLLEERDQKERFRLREAPWATYERLKKIADKRGQE